MHLHIEELPKGIAQDARRLRSLTSYQDTGVSVLDVSRAQCPLLPEAHKPDAHRNNLLELVFRVVAHWPRLNGNDLAFGLILLPGAVSRG